VKVAQKTLVVLYHHTHWDREWWATFEDFRFRLVHTIDALLDALERDPAFTTFVLDGQNIVLRDYLEVRPENRERLVELVRAGRIHVGPWYVLADHFLTSGEAAIRNLFQGERVARSLGVESTRIGYLPDQFGHIGQMPQILAGFGIDKAVVWRGFGAAPPAKMSADFWWESPDRTRVRGLYLAKEYYRSHYKDGEGAERLRAFLEEMRPHAASGVILEPYGGDHLPVDPRITAHVSEIGGELQDEGVEYRIGSLEDYFEALVREGAEPAETWRGEARAFGRRAHLLPGVLSSRLHLKRANHDVQTLLERYAEPFQALSWMLGGRYEQEYLWHAWGLLLQNQPHDSICGCSIDEVHREMLPRFEQARQVASLLAATAQERIAALMDAGEVEVENEPVVVFNPLNWTRSEPVSVPLNPTHGIEPRAWRLLDPEGSEVHFQVRSVEALQPRYDSADWTEAVFVAEDVPALGWRAYRFERRERPLPANRRLDTLLGAPAREKGAARTTGLAIGSGRMANEFLEVEVEADGALTVNDLTTGLVYEGLNRYRDAGDAGDTYNHSAPPGDRVLTTDGGAASWEWVETGPARATLRIRHAWSLPAGLTADRQSRSHEQVAFPLTTEVTLAAHSRRIEIAVSGDNSARDHRLQALFPLGAPIRSSAAESVFEVVERPAGVPAGQRDSAEPAVPEHPQQGFVSVSAPGRALTIANRGLPEFSAEPDGVVALTLLRAVGWLSREDFTARIGGAGPTLPTPEAQVPGRFRAEYAVIPHAQSWAEARSHLAAHAYRAPLAAVALKPQGSPRPLPWPERRPELRSCGSLLEIEGDVVLSALKRAEDRDRLVVRVLNEAARPARARIRPLRNAVRAELVDLGEKPIQGLTVEDGWVETEIKPWALGTVAFEF
jgi:alpha-mannosidase